MGVMQAEMASDSKKVRPGMRPNIRAAQTSQAQVMTSRRRVVKDFHAFLRYALAG